MQLQELIQKKIPTKASIWVSVEDVVTTNARSQPIESHVDITDSDRSQERRNVNILWNGISESHREQKYLYISGSSIIFLHSPCKAESLCIPRHISAFLLTVNKPHSSFIKMRPIPMVNPITLIIIRIHTILADTSGFP